MPKKRSTRKAHQSASAHHTSSSRGSCSSCAHSSTCPSYPRALSVATGIFALIAVLHGYRFFVGFEVRLDGMVIPVWFSGVLALLAFGMAYWCYSERCRA